MRDRARAIVLGVLLTTPALWLWSANFSWETWYTDGFALICGATGIALILAAVGGPRPDWIDPNR